MTSTPEPRFPVYIDASSAILLFKTGLFRQLADCYKPVMTPSVLDEVTVFGQPGALYFQSLARQGIIRVETPGQDGGSPKQPPGMHPTLGKGEQDTLQLFTERSSGFIIIDDGKGAKLCRISGFPYINALLVPRLLWFAERMTEAEAAMAMQQLCSMGRYSDDVKTKAFRLSRTDLAWFLNPETGTGQDTPGTGMAGSGTARHKGKTDE